MGRLRTKFLPSSQSHAVIENDFHIPGALILSVGGAEQSHVNLASPGDIFYEYLQRVAHLVELAASERGNQEGLPLRVLHLGAGALTLARFISFRYPQVEQTAVDLDPELMEFVLAEIPLSADGPVTLKIGDAQTVLAELSGPFDLIILDIFDGEDSPAHLYSSAFFELLSNRLRRPTGLALVNIGDDPPLTFTDTVLHSARRIFSTDQMLLTGPAPMFERTQAGNMILALTAAKELPAGWPAQLVSLGPHPAAVLFGETLERFLVDGPADTTDSRSSVGLK